MYLVRQASQVALVVKDMPANTGNIRDIGRSPGRGDPLEEGPATHSSILAWRIPWREEPGRLQSMGSQSQTQLRLSLSLWALRDAPLA